MVTIIIKELHIKNLVVLLEFIEEIGVGFTSELYDQHKRKFVQIYFVLIDKL